MLFRKSAPELWICFMLLSVSISGCYYDVAEELYPGNAQDCDTTHVTYVTTIEPFIQNKCTVCHSQAANQGNVNLEGYSQVKSFADNGKLLGAISHAQGFSAMPQGASKLPECTINQVKAWINKGAVNN